MESPVYLEITTGIPLDNASTAIWGLTSESDGTTEKIAVAALAQLSERRPLVVACPTGTDAGQLYDDLMQYMPPGEVELFPAWETLPFERVSPSVETMGHRLQVLWRLR